MKSVYLAGPDVFLPDAIMHGERLKALCLRYGFKAHFPLDNTINENEISAQAEAIRLANLALIERCDCVLANLSPFRGPEPDSGTVFEVGYAVAKGKTVVGYSSDLTSLKERTNRLLKLNNSDRDHEGLLIEDFGLSHNLMFATYIKAASAEEALKWLQASC
jgi:nucleoside 2-deoxyribosyltransferase